MLVNVGRGKWLLYVEEYRYELRDKTVTANVGPGFCSKFEWVLLVGHCIDSLYSTLHVRFQRFVCHGRDLQQEVAVPHEADNFARISI